METEHCYAQLMRKTSEKSQRSCISEISLLKMNVQASIQRWRPNQNQDESSTKTNVQLPWHACSSIKICNILVSVSVVSGYALLQLQIYTHTTTKSASHCVLSEPGTRGRQGRNCTEPGGVILANPVWSTKLC